ncbi:MAG: SpoIIE family protein phosphatase [Gammaproteobacteria bacterium]
MGPLIDSGIAARTLAGEAVSGDRAWVRITSHRVLAAVIDGLGHGEAAGLASERAVEALDMHVDDEPAVQIERCHQALKGTRGAAMSLATIDAREGNMTWLGVGNVEGQLLRVSAMPPSLDSLLTRGGVVGYQLPPLRAYRLPIIAGDLLIFTTDGINSHFPSHFPVADPLLRRQPAQEIADHLLARFGKTTDDALVLVIRYLGSAS